MQELGKWGCPPCVVVTVRTHMRPASATDVQPPGSLIAFALACILVLAGGALTCLIR